MKAEITVKLSSDIRTLSFLYSPLRLEGLSSPPGGVVDVSMEGPSLIIRMTSDEVSTSRAMLNSYMGLLSAALRSASGEHED
ncbi:MAG: KEOPS complex subunit Pcc1 [Thermoplasmatota archaeon]